MTPDGVNLVGRRAPEFELPDTEGTVHGLGDFADRWLLLVFHRHLA